jgi:hypothetical protein
MLDQDRMVPIARLTVCIDLTSRARAPVAVDLQGTLGGDFSTGCWSSSVEPTEQQASSNERLRRAHWSRPPTGVHHATQ